MNAMQKCLPRDGACMNLINEARSDELRRKVSIPCLQMIGTVGGARCHGALPVCPDYYTGGHASQVVQPNTRGDAANMSILRKRVSIMFKTKLCFWQCLDSEREANRSMGMSCLAAGEPLHLTATAVCTFCHSAIFAAFCLLSGPPLLSVLNSSAYIIILHQHAIPSPSLVTSINVSH
ncbi:hypothetical protein IF2G_02959 [Cordyceps javanica]|nr:hypothetical protein IF2G_02959 [Cordyceps javanica]